MPNWWDKYPVHSGEAGGSALPTTGQESALTNPMAGMGTTPAYQSDEDWQAIAADVALNQGKGLSSIINQSPGHMQRKAYAEGIGKAQAGLAERQRAGMDVLSSLQQLVDTAKASQGEDAASGRKGDRLNEAIGPYNDMSGEVVKGLVGLPSAMTIKSLWNPEAYDLNNRLHHDIEGLTTSFITSASKGGLNMSDARQKAFADTMGAMMKATKPDEFYKIAKDAENIVRDSFGIPADAQLAPYTTQGKVLQDQQRAETGSSEPVNPRLSFVPQDQPMTFAGLPKGWKITKKGP